MLSAQLFQTLTYPCRCSSGINNHLGNIFYLVEFLPDVQHLLFRMRLDGKAQMTYACFWICCLSNDRQQIAFIPTQLASQIKYDTPAILHHNKEGNFKGWGLQLPFHRYQYRMPTKRTVDEMGTGILMYHQLTTTFAQSSPDFCITWITWTA